MAIGRGVTSLGERPDAKLFRGIRRSLMLDGMLYIYLGYRLALVDGGGPFTRPFGRPEARCGPANCMARGRSCCSAECLGPAW